jgi:hypothetical protein
MRRLLFAFASLLCAACGDGSNGNDAGADFAKLADLKAPADMAAAIADMTAPPDMTAPTVYTIFVRGTLKNDVATSKMLHDQLVSGAKVQAMMLGDLYHDTFLNLLPPPDGGNPPPSTDLLWIDQWNDLNGLMQFSTDPNVMAGLAMIFSAPPTITVTSEPMSWTEWGNINPLPQLTPLYLFSIRGTLKGPTTDDSRMYHNTLASGFEAQAMQAGDKCHHVWLELADMTQFQAVDLWDNLAGPQMVYGDPQFQTAFGMLFTGPPNVEPYYHTDWAHW